MPIAAPKQAAMMIPALLPPSMKTTTAHQAAGPPTYLMNRFIIKTIDDLAVDHGKQYRAEDLPAPQE